MVNVLIPTEIVDDEEATGEVTFTGQAGLEDAVTESSLALVSITSFLPQSVTQQVSDFSNELVNYSRKLYENFAKLQKLIRGVNPDFLELRDLVSFQQKLEVISRKIPTLEQEQRALEQRTIGLEQMLYADDLAELRDAIRFITEYVTHDFKGISSTAGIHLQMLREDIAHRLPQVRDKILKIGGESLNDPSLLKTIPKVLNDVMRAEDRERLQKIRSCVNHGYRESQFLAAAVNKSYPLENTDVAHIFKEAFYYVFKVKYKQMLRRVEVEYNFSGSAVVKSHPGALYRALYNHLNNIAEEIRKDSSNKQHQIGFNIYHIKDVMFIDIRDTCGGFPNEFLNGPLNGSVAGYSSKSDEERKRGFGSRLADNAMQSVGGILFLGNHDGHAVTSKRIGSLQSSREPSTVGAAYIISLPK